MSEKSANKTLLDRLDEAHFKIYRVENKVGPGHPDFHFLAPFVLDYKAGWIESKWIDKLPTKMSDRVTIEFKPLQPPWIWDYREAGGRVWISLLVGKGPRARWMLFDGCWVHSLAFIPGRTKSEDRPTLADLEMWDRWKGVEDWGERAQTLAMADFQIIQEFSKGPEPPAPALGAAEREHQKGRSPATIPPKPQEAPKKRAARKSAPKKRAAKGTRKGASKKAPKR